MEAKKYRKKLDKFEKKKKGGGYGSITATSSTGAATSTVTTSAVGKVLGSTGSNNDIDKKIEVLDILELDDDGTTIALNSAGKIEDEVKNTIKDTKSGT